ncbi:MAG: PD40 domain-containing protein [Chloroflexi bacterium]|nr:PD40 domain-containing protein [Chloroflexota bacterium]
MKQLKWLLLILLVAAAFAAFAVPSIFADNPGSSPFEALMISGAPTTLAPQSSMWFYFDYSGDRSKIRAELTDYQTDNVRLAIFTPQQAYEWIQDPKIKPVGWGTKAPPQNDEIKVYKQTWEGAFNFPGRFYAVVFNDNANTSITFRAYVTGESVTLYPTPTPSPYPTPIFKTPVAQGVATGKFVFQQWAGGPIYTVNGDGSGLKRILNEGIDPAWSPNATQIAFARWGANGGLRVANADGSNERGVFASSQLVSPRWSPDGKKIVFSQQKGGKPESSFAFGRSTFTLPAEPYWKLGVVELDKVISENETETQFTEPACTRHCFSPSWSNDPRYIGYTDVGVLRTDVISNTVKTIYDANPRVQTATLSPDGNRVALQIWQNDHWQVAIMVWDGTNITGMTPANPFEFRPVNNVAPAWSPDGTQLIFLSDRNGKWEFFAINIDGTGLRQVLKNVTDSVGIVYNFSNERMIDWAR